MTLQDIHRWLQGQYSSIHWPATAIQQAYRQMLMAATEAGRCEAVSVPLTQPVTRCMLPHILHSSVQISKLAIIFNRLDVNGDRQLDLGEFEEGLTQVHRFCMCSSLHFDSSRRMECPLGVLHAGRFPAL